MNRDEIREYFCKEGLIYFDEKLNDRYFYPKDFPVKVYKKFLEIAGISPVLETKLALINLGLLKKGKMTNAGALIFCKKSSLIIPGASLNCCLFQGTSKTKILDQKIYDADLLSNYQSGVAYIKSHLYSEYIMGFERKERLELPEDALREALVNAMAHRDYRKPGDLQLHIYQDRVEIINPGGLVGGLKIEELGKKSIPRNPQLFGLMQRMDLVEKVGSGFRRIRENCDEYNIPMPKVETNNDWFTIIFARPSYKPKSKLDTSQVTGEVQRLLSVVQGEMKRMELQEALGLKHEDHFREAYLKPSLNGGFIVMTIPDKPKSKLQKYCLTPKGVKILSILKIQRKKK